MNKKKFIIFPCIGLCIALIIIGVIFALPKDRVVIKIGDTEITETEFLMVFENEVRADMLGKVIESNATNPWESSYNGKPLKELALEATMEKLSDYVAQQKLFSQYDVCEWSYKYFKDKYSKKLSDAYSKDEIQYGTQSYTEYDYYVYLHSIYRIDVEEKLMAETKEQEIYDYYTENGDLFRDTDVYVFERYSVDKTAENASDLIKKAATGEIDDKVSVSTVTVDAYTSKYDEALGMTVDLGEDIYSMQYAGAEIFKENENELLFIKTVSYTKGEIRNYKDCKELVKDRYSDYLFEKKISEIRISLNPLKTKHYNKIKLY